MIINVTEHAIVLDLDNNKVNALDQSKPQRIQEQSCHDPSPSPSPMSISKVQFQIFTVDLNTKINC